MNPDDPERDSRPATQACLSRSGFIRACIGYDILLRREEEERRPILIVAAVLQAGLVLFSIADGIYQYIRAL